jgi:tetratricopeptide (TPR) repeat protein
MIQKRLALTALTFLSLAAFAQPKKQTAPRSKSNAHLKVFSMAIGSGDGNTAVAALNYYLSEQGENNVYADTLAMLYMQQGQFTQCYHWADKRLKTKPDDNALLEMKGVSLDKLGQPKEAIDIFEKLFAKTKNPYHAYKLMEMQYGIKRLAECLATAQAAEKLEYKPDFLMTYNVGQQTGRTYLQAGVYNIHALALYDLDKKADAKTYFEKALALDSTFALAKQNLDAMQSIEAGGGKNVQPAAGQPSASPANKQN